MIDKIKSIFEVLPDTVCTKCATIHKKETYALKDKTVILNCSCGNELKLSLTDSTCTFKSSFTGITNKTKLVVGIPFNYVSLVEEVRELFSERFVINEDRNRAEERKATLSKITRSSRIRVNKWFIEISQQKTQKNGTKPAWNQSITLLNPEKVRKLSFDYSPDRNWHYHNYINGVKNKTHETTTDTVKDAVEKISRIILGK
jgi:stringent starvation protein B